MIQKQSEKRIFIFLLLDFLSQAFQNHVAVGKQGGLSDRASYRESDDIKFILSNGWSSYLDLCFLFG